MIGASRFGDTCVNCGAVAQRKESDRGHWWECSGDCGSVVVASECISCRNPGGERGPTRPATRLLVGRPGEMAGEMRHLCDEHADKLLRPPFVQWWIEPSPPARVRARARVAGDRAFDVLALCVELLLWCLPIGTLAYVSAAAGINAGATLLGLVMLPAYFAGRFAAARQLEHLQRQAREIIEQAERERG